MKPYTLTNREGESISPMVSTKTVFDEHGVDLDTLLARQQQAGEDALKDYAKRDELTQGLNGKQDKLTPTEDLRITEDNIIGLTDAAKMRLFIDMWNAACAEFGMWGTSPKTVWGRYNPDTCLFELNGLTDITYEEAVRIYLAGPILLTQTSITQKYNNNYEIRTNLPIKYSGGAKEANYGFVSATKLEVINARFLSLYISSIYHCPNLRRILSPVSMSRNIDNFRRCPKLEELELQFTNTAVMSVSFADCPLLSLASFQYMIANAVNTAPIAITVHPDVYAKLTDESNTEWNAVLTAAAEKNITFATI